MNHKAWHNIYKRSAALLMLLLFVGYYSDVHFFAHAHVINGVSIVHSHFHNSSHGKTQDGGHTASDILLIANHCNQLLTTEATLQEDCNPFVNLLLCFCVEHNCLLTTHETLCKAGRAPPVA